MNIRDVSDDGMDEIAKKVKNELLNCRECGHKNGKAERLFHKLSDDTFRVGIEYECEKCGADNHNTITLK